MLLFVHVSFSVVEQQRLHLYYINTSTFFKYNTFIYTLFRASAGAPVLIDIFITYNVFIYTLFRASASRS